MPEIWKVVRTFRVAVVAIAILALLGRQFLAQFGTTIYRYGAYTLWIVALAVFGWIGYRINRIRWKVKREHYLLCLNCLYTLKGLEPSGKCPECGTAYNIETLKNEWVNSLRKAPF